MQLIGTVTGETSWAWTPTTYLNNSGILNPISTPNVPIQYILSATDGTCTDYDTVDVLHGNKAYAGVSQSICLDDTVLLGTHFDGAMFLGIMNWLKYGTSDFTTIYDNYLTTNSIPFHQYFTNFLVKYYTNYAGSMWATYVQMDTTRRKIHATDWYRRYYKEFVDNQASQASLDLFYTLLEADADLKAEVRTYTFVWNSAQLDQIFTDYQYAYNSNATDLETVWEFKDDSVWVPFDGTGGTTNWTDYAKLWDNPPVTREYRYTLIDNLMSTVEYDSIKITVDTTVMPDFYNAYQTDSTVYFSNTTVPFSTTFTYTWNFGDGSPTSHAWNPHHTFVKFDSTYRVCLTVTTACGDSTFCDSVTVDSIGLLNGGFHKKGRDIPAVVSEIIDKPTFAASGNSLSVNVPNPFSSETIVQYSLADGVKAAQISIATPLGQPVRSYTLHQRRGLIAIDGANLADGMYYYYLIVDGSIVKCKAMIVQK